MDKLDIGMKLRSLRENTGYDAKDVSEILNDKFNLSISHKTLYGYEKGRTSPDINVFLALCVIYKCDDVLYEFGYSNKKEVWKHSKEEREVIEKYNELDGSGKDVIRSALGLGINPERIKDIC